MKTKFKKEGEIIVIKQSLWFKLLPFIFYFIATLIILYQEYDHLSFDFSFLGSFVISAFIIFFLYSIFPTKIILTNTYLRFAYHFWFAWRNKSIKIETIKSIYYKDGPKSPLVIEVNTWISSKVFWFYCFGMAGTDMDKLFDEFRRHPLDRRESGLV